MNVRRKDHIATFVVLSIVALLTLVLFSLLIGHINKKHSVDQDIERLERYYALGQYQLVIENYETLGMDERLLSEPLFTYGMSCGLLYLQQGDQENLNGSLGALTLLQSLYELPSKQLFEVLDLSGRLYYAGGSYRECIQSFLTILDSFELPDTRVYELYIGLSQGSLGLVSQMERTLSDLAENSRSLRLRMATLFRDAGSYQKALEYLQELEESALQTEQKCRILWMEIEILDTIEKPVIPLLQRVLKLDCSANDSYRAALKLSEEYRELGQMIEAQQMSREAKTYGELLEATRKKD